MWFGPSKSCDCAVTAVSAIPPDAGQVVIAWSNNDLCNKYSADDSGSLLYRIVKRLHIIVHILRCGTGL